MSIEVRNFTPNNQSINVSTITDIEFDLVGLDGDQIDISTLSVQIDTASNIIQDETNTILYDLEADPDLVEIQYTGNSDKKNYYKVHVIPGVPFDENQRVTIKVNVKTYVISPAVPEEMEEYESSFTTMNNGVISDFKFAFIEDITKIPVYAEVLRPNDSTSPTIFYSAFGNWNVRPRTIVRRNQLIINSGFSVDYKNGQIIIDNDNLSHGPIDYSDQIDVDYTFNYFTDEEIKAYFKQAAAIWRVNPPFGGPNNIWSAGETYSQILMVGAAMYAYRQLLLGLTIQEKRIIFDNESWDDGWKQTKDIFKELYQTYKEMWEKLLEAKKVNLPNIASVVTPSYTLPGGRSRFFRYLYK